MRIGLNPQKDKEITFSHYLHQIVIPVFIPNQEGYFKESFDVFKVCLQSLFQTIHDKTFITIVNNGSGEFVKDYLDGLLRLNKIHEVIHTENIGKVNAVLKGLIGNKIPLLTITDSDVFFKPGWQNETSKIFKNIPKAGVVGLVPQFKSYTYNCSNVIFDNFNNKKMQFLKVPDPEAMIHFYDSIGWKRDYNQDYLKYNLGLKIKDDFCVFIGCGHFTATYKKDIFEEVIAFSGYKLGGTSLNYLDTQCLKKDYWRLCTYENYAYHMGNILEKDFEEKLASNKNTKAETAIPFEFSEQRKTSKLLGIIKNKIFPKLFKIKIFYKFFLLKKKLPKDMADTF